MLHIMLSTNISQMILIHQTKDTPERWIRNLFKLHLFLNHWSKFKIISQKCFRQCPVTKLQKKSLTLLNKRANRTTDTKYLLTTFTSPVPLLYIKKSSQKYCPWCPFYKITHMFALLRSLPTPGRFFFQKKDFFHFLIFCSTSYYKQNNSK